MEHYVLKKLEDQGMLASPQNTQSLKRQASQGLSNFLCKMVQIDFCAILAKKWDESCGALLFKLSVFSGQTKGMYYF